MYDHTAAHTVYRCDCGHPFTDHGNDIDAFMDEVAVHLRFCLHLAEARAWEASATPTGEPVPDVIGQQLDATPARIPAVVCREHEHRTEQTRVWAGLRRLIYATGAVLLAGGLLVLLAVAS